MTDFRKWMKVFVRMSNFWMLYHGASIIKDRQTDNTVIQQCNSVCFLAYVWSEHGAQYDLQRSAHPGVSAVLQSRPLQQTDERRSAHFYTGHRHREQDSGSYRYIRWETAAGVDQKEDSCLLCQFDLSLYQPLFFSHHSLSWEGPARSSLPITPL